MSLIFCEPILTMADLREANVFFEECKNLLNKYITDCQYISNSNHVNQLLSKDAEKKDVFVFFTSENGQYEQQMLKLINKYNIAKSRIWPIAMNNNLNCRKPPDSISDRQSFDVSCRNENRNPLKNNMKAIAQLLVRKLISQILSPLYQDEVLYFISHRRSDGEHIVAKLADELKLLTRERNIYRDVVNVEVGNDAQKDIDDNLERCDVLIFIQTEQAQYSDYIMKELCYALVYNTPILWIQIDNADYSKMKIHPGEAPILCYKSDEFDDEDRIIDIADEIEDKCFELMMNSSNQVYTYVDYLLDMANKDSINLISDKNSILAYEIEYKEKVKDRYESGIRKHYIQCFGRTPKDSDLQIFKKNAIDNNIYDKNDKLFLLSNHIGKEKYSHDIKILEDNYDDYIMNLENVLGRVFHKKDKRIVLSGAFPETDEIYKLSLFDALVTYSKHIIKNGYTLVFGAHPTFQQIIFDIGKLYSPDIKYSIEMHMDSLYINEYDIEHLKENCTLIMSEGLQTMREKMISDARNEMLICMGGKIKEDKRKQGVDIEIGIAQKAGVPIALVGTVGGRSSEYAYEMYEKKDWSKLNPWENSLNENLFYNLNHRLMIRQLLEKIEK